MSAAFGHTFNTAIVRSGDGENVKQKYLLAFEIYHTISRVTKNRGWPLSLRRKLGGHSFSFDTSELRVFYRLALIKSSAM